MKKITAVVLALVLVSASVPIGAYTVPVVEVGPNVASNILNQVTNWLSLIEEIQLVYQDYQQLVAAYRELENLANPKDRIIGHIVHGITEELRATDGFGYGRQDIEDVFRDAFPGYDIPPDFDPVEQAHQTNRRVLETVRVILKGLEWGNQNNISGHLDLEQFKDRLLSAEGNLAATQAAGMLESWGGQEASRGALYLQMVANMQAVEMAERAQREASLATTVEGWMEGFVAPAYEQYPVQTAAPF
ncbi:MAG: hypothetical protein KDD47_26340 [Acidobacteria bacterium]|nr:hypothetical protein [Acidobacteriota bacterium]